MRAARLRSAKLLPENGENKEERPPRTTAARPPYVNIYTGEMRLHGTQAEVRIRVGLIVGPTVLSVPIFLSGPFPRVPLLTLFRAPAARFLPHPPCARATPFRAARGDRPPSPPPPSHPWRTSNPAVIYIAPVYASREQPSPSF